ncbi:Hint domain-containing protein [Celeribacter sp.]|uniref:Hint domain-containing protein n=1 Tax=Celeribacter sp. TaxID=1890673 RepID=UPI003A8FA6CE
MNRADFSAYNTSFIYFAGSTLIETAKGHVDVADLNFGDRVRTMDSGYKDLLELAGVSVATELIDVTYYHFMFDQHEVVFANGVPTENLYMGKMALETLTPEACAELKNADAAYTPKPARVFVKGRKARHMITRHIKSGQPTLSAPF